ncbi:MAG: hypothetical protein FJ265_04045 [Planctomycetes bacterium]|nr:hypothetical protein [Planctomycetota bacterium]
MLPRSPGSSNPLRIYMVGAHATGKTTLARWVRDHYGVPMIAEVARGVLAEMEAQLDTLRTDIALVNRYQREVFQRQIEAERKVQGPFVSDRAFCNLAYAAHHSTILGDVFQRQIEAERKVQGPFVSDRAFCNLAYAAHHSTILGDVFRDRRLADYMDWVRQGIVFFLRPHRELVVADGVRAGLEWEEVVRIDGMVKLLLEVFDVPYIPVESLSMQERVRLVERVLDLARLTPPDTLPPANPSPAAAAEGARRL